MTKILRCDICDEEFDLDAIEPSWAEFWLPSTWLPVRAEDGEDNLKLDICSVECLANLVDALVPAPEESDGQQPDNKDETEPAWQPPDPGFEVKVR